MTSTRRGLREVRRLLGTSTIAWGLVVAAFGLTGASVLVHVVAGTPIAVYSTGFVWAITLVFTLTGLLIALRHPANAIGWLFLGIGVSAGV
ncbi:hypothetical protein, partial [Aeromicrobium sp.]|uniref:hypothetical protein n=1 Tax=Aeromicrobium sp. TaxID=1871063 RepID=UPI003C61B94E